MMQKVAFGGCVKTADEGQLARAQPPRQIKQTQDHFAGTLARTEYGGFRCAQQLPMTAKLSGHVAAAGSGACANRSNSALSNRSTVIILRRHAPLFEVR